jgi:hypothetical protein
MRFVCLGLMDEGFWDAMSKTEQEAYIEECLSYDDELLAAGHWVGSGEALQISRTAKTLRREGGKVVATDGPFAETKEQLGGFGELEARDMEQAVELMSRHPGLRSGAFEIRPVDEDVTKRCTEHHAAPDAPAVGQRFVCIAFGDEDNWTRLPDAEREALLESCVAFGDELNKVGRVMGGVALQSAKTAKTLRASGGKVIVTDGPYAETKEQLGGVAIFTINGMDQAVNVWSDHPCLRAGDVLEIRPVDVEFEARWAQRQASLQAN